MSIQSPLWLVAAPVLAAGVWALGAYAARRRADALALFLGRRADTAAYTTLARRRRTRTALVAGAVALGAVALAGPTWGTATRAARQESLDLVVALDVSNSMRVADVAPTRLDRARLDVLRLTEGRRGDRVGLVIFAGEAFLQCPLTSDMSAVRLFLDAVDPEQVVVQGTDFARALVAAESAFDAEDGAADRTRAILVVSDGEDHEGGLQEAADRLRERGVTLLALGIGTDAGGTIPDMGMGGVKRDRSGRAVVSTVDEAALRQIAGRDGVFRAGPGTVAAVGRRLDALDRSVVAEARVATGAERYQWPLALALLLLVAERWLATQPVPDPSGRRSQPEPASP